MIKELKAKPRQTLYGHMKDCLSVWQLFLRWHQPAWETAVTRLGYNPGLAINILTAAVYAHDLGKATIKWQQYLDTGQGRITHALFSMLMLKDILQPELQDKEESKAALLAVLAHHGMLYHGAFAGERANSLGKQDIPVSEVNKILQHLPGFESVLTPLTADNCTGSQGAREINRLRRHVEEMDPEAKLRFKGLYTMFLSALQLCDNEASCQYQAVIDTKPEQVLGPVLQQNTALRYVSRPEKAFSSFMQSSPGTSPNNLQLAVSGAEKPYIILQAGCGSGKTAAALHYASSLYRKGAINRVIITLPTRFTTNSMYWDFSQSYGLGTEHTGIFHGEMESVLFNTGINEANKEKDRHISDLKFEHSFFNRPVNVCTVDHLLYSLLHCHKYADRAFGNLMSSAVIFDEIHFYDQYTLKKIGQCLQLLRQLNVPHMVMSATIPKSIVQYLKEEAQWDNVDYHFIRQQDNDEAVSHEPFTITKMTGPMIEDTNVSKELLSLVQKNINLRQMVVVNQVERAKTVALELSRTLQGVNIICYHSEFTRQDRDEKERIIRTLFKPVAERTAGEIEMLLRKGYSNTSQVILVSTQVCEMSLNISADVMYSEIAPVDAVVQRGGRLHRRGKHWRAETCRCPRCEELPADHHYQLYLFPLHWDDTKSHLPYRGEVNGKPLLQQSWNIIGEVYSFSKAVDWVDELYPEPPEMQDQEMMKFIIEDAVFGRRPRDRFGNDYGDTSSGSFKVRRSDTAAVTVVPASLLPEGSYDPVQLVKDCGVRVSLSKLYWKKENWAVKEVQHNGEKYILNVLNLPYTWDVGFQYQYKFKS
ncbi:MAG: CRISPR-associated helicase Cas3' [Desulfotomaculum sp.]|nr:CRISPR-associated helicase Cas3' [Desulfotomaculum sp.]